MLSLLSLLSGAQAEAAYDDVDTDPTTGSGRHDSPDISSFVRRHLATTFFVREPTVLLRRLSSVGDPDPVMKKTRRNDDPAYCRPTKRPRRDEDSTGRAASASPGLEGMLQLALSNIYDSLPLQDRLNFSAALPPDVRLDGTLMTSVKRDRCVGQLVRALLCSAPVMSEEDATRACEKLLKTLKNEYPTRALLLRRFPRARSVGFAYGRPERQTSSASGVVDEEEANECARSLAAHFPARTLCASKDLAFFDAVLSKAQPDRLPPAVIRDIVFVILNREKRALLRFVFRHQEYGPVFRSALESVQYSVLLFRPEHVDMLREVDVYVPQQAVRAALAEELQHFFLCSLESWYMLRCNDGDKKLSKVSRWIEKLQEATEQ